MSNDTNDQELLDGLKALSDSAFPKECANCGRVYHSPEDFVTQSENLGGRSGLKSSYDDDDRPIIELFRNCICGSTLMDFFSDRRDTSPGGLKRREVFAKMLTHLESRGMEVEVARKELLKLMQGDRSEQLESMGIELKARRYDQGGNGE